MGRLVSQRRRADKRNRHAFAIYVRLFCTFIQKKYARKLRAHSVNIGMHFMFLITLIIRSEQASWNPCKSGNPVRLVRVVGVRANDHEV